MNFTASINHKNYRIFLGIISFVGLLFAAITTSQYGPGVSSDAARILSTAENIAAGNGFVDMVGFPLLWWPPLYPLLLAGGKALTGLSAFEIAWIINLILYPVNLWLWGELLWHVFEKTPAYAIWAAALMVLSRSTLRLYANVFSEPIFITVFLVFFLSAARYLETGSRKSLWIMTLMTGLSILLRYVGVSLIGVLGLLMLYKEGGRSIGRASWLGFLAALPGGLWVYFHNYLEYHSLFGPRNPDQFLPLENLSLMLTKMLNWFAPLHPLIKPVMLRPWILIAAIALVLLILNDRAKWRNWFYAAVGNPHFLPQILFAALYLILMTFTVNTIDHRDLTSDRYYIVIFPIVLAFIFLSLDELVFSHVALRRKPTQAVLTVLVLGSFIYPAFSIQEYIRKARVSGEPTNYNIDNTAAFANLELFKVAHRFVDDEPEALLASNYAPIVWFQFQRPMVTMPFQDASLPQEQKLERLKKDYSTWAGNASVYIIWILPNEYTHYAPPENLGVIRDIQLLYEDETGKIYYAKNK